MKLLVSFTWKNCSFFWSEACQEAFQRLKVMVANTQVLRHYDFGRPTVFETDCLDYMNSGVLSQADNNRVLYPIFFYDKNFLPAE